MSTNEGNFLLDGFVNRPYIGVILIQITPLHKKSMVWFGLHAGHNSGSYFLKREAGLNVASGFYQNMDHIDPDQMLMQHDDATCYMANKVLTYCKQCLMTS